MTEAQTGSPAEPTGGSAKSERKKASGLKSRRGHAVLSSVLTATRPQATYLNAKGRLKRISAEGRLADSESQEHADGRLARVIRRHRRSLAEGPRRARSFVRAPRTSALRELHLFAATDAARACQFLTRCETGVHAGKYLIKPK
jgi:hypothetical protein